MRQYRFAALLLLILGVLTIGTGGYFLFVRPPLLPEDIRATGVASELLPPAMLYWLRIVFQTLGGFVAGFGICIVAVSVHIMTQRRGVLEWGMALGLLVAFGRFLASNIILRSDYLWFIGVLFALAAVTALCFVWNTRRGPNSA
jgi:hypothetical protein